MGRGSVVAEQEQEQASVPVREIKGNEPWKLKKPPPSWAPQLIDKETRAAAWQELSEDERIYLSDQLGQREKYYG